MLFFFLPGGRRKGGWSHAPVRAYARAHVKAFNAFKNFRFPSCVHNFARLTSYTPKRTSELLYCTGMLRGGEAARPTGKLW